MGTKFGVRHWRVVLVLLTVLSGILVCQRYFSYREWLETQPALLDLLVLDADTGQPIPSVEIGVKPGLPCPHGNFWDTTGERPGPPLFKEYTNHGGCIRLEGQRSGQMTVFFKAPNHQMKSLECRRIRPGQTRHMAAKLKPAEDVFGTVVDANGKPIEGTMLFADYLPAESVHEKTSPSNLERGCLAVTNDKGEFRFPVLPPVVQRIGLYHPECVPAWKSVASRHPRRSCARFVLERCGVLEGRVSFGGEPAPPGDVKVTVRNRPDGKTFSCATRSDKNGVFVLKEVLPGQACVEYSCESKSLRETGCPPLYRRMKRMVDILPGQPNHVALDFAATTSSISCAIRGVQNSLIISGPRFSVRNPDTGEYACGVLDMVEGGERFQSAPLPSGSCWLQAGDNAHSKPVLLYLQPNQATVAEIDMRPGAASIHVGVAVPRYWYLRLTLYAGEVTISPDENGRWPSPGYPDNQSYLHDDLSCRIVRQCNSYSGESSFNFDSLEPGIYTLYARAEGGGKTNDPPTIGGVSAVTATSTDNTVHVALPLWCVERAKGPR